MGTSRRLLVRLLFVSGFAAFFLPDVAVAVCGNGVVEGPAEQCDDGNTDSGDCCAPDCTFDALFTRCESGAICLAGACDGSGVCTTGPRFCVNTGRADLKDPGAVERQSIKARFRAEQSQLTLADLGDPTVDTRYGVCITGTALQSDEMTLLYEFELPTGTGWQKTSKGFLYRRPAGASTPLRRVRINAEYREVEGFGWLDTATTVAGKGAGLSLPGPVDTAQYFDLAEFFSLSFCIVNDLGFAAGPRTLSPFMINDPDHVGWRPNKLGD